MTGALDPFEPGEQQEADEAKRERKRLREIDDLKWVMADARGRRFVARLLQHAGVNQAIFHESGAVMAFREGQRAVGLLLTAEMLEHTPKAYF